MLAFLTNREQIQRSRECWCERDTWISGYVRDAVREDRRFFSKLWKLSAQWPEQQRPWLGVFRTMHTDDETKADVYKVTKCSSERYEILRSCSADDFRTLSLGATEKDNLMRERVWQTMDRATGIKFRSLEGYLSIGNIELLRKVAWCVKEKPMWLERIQETLLDNGDVEGAEEVGQNIPWWKPGLLWKLRSFLRRWNRRYSVS
jgi:hypothetical protein